MKKFLKTNIKRYFYAVKEGHNPGIYDTWEECKKNVEGYNKPIYKKFETKEDAQLFIEGEYLQIPDELITNLKCDAYNPDENYEFEKWNKYNNEYYIFTDGSEKKLINNKKITRFAIYFGEECLNVVQREFNSTNNRCELFAIQYALEVILINKTIIKEYQKTENENIRCNCINIISDSNYCVNSCNKWIYDWQKNGWYTATSKEVSNQDILRSILFSLNKLKLHKVNIKFEHINSHCPPPLSDEYKLFLWKGNYIVDKLAQGI